MVATLPTEFFYVLAAETDSQPCVGNDHWAWYVTVAERSDQTMCSKSIDEVDITSAKSLLPIFVFFFSRK